MSLSTGTHLGPYEIVSAIGAGGMGEVYRARDARLGRDVAIKVLPPAFASDPDRVRRFEQEARATGMLNHPNILAIHDIGTYEGSPYLVAELLEGQTLFERFRTQPQGKRRASCAGEGGGRCCCWFLPHWWPRVFSLGCARASRPHHPPIISSRFAAGVSRARGSLLMDRPSFMARPLMGNPLSSLRRIWAAPNHAP